MLMSERTVVYKVFALMKNNTRSFQREFKTDGEAIDWMVKQQKFSWNKEWNCLQVEAQITEHKIIDVAFP